MKDDAAGRAQNVQPFFNLSISTPKRLIWLQTLVREIPKSCAAADFGVEIVICEMSLDLMGFKKEEFIDYPNISMAGVAKFLQEAGSSKVTLFV